MDAWDHRAALALEVARTRAPRVFAELWTALEPELAGWLRTPSFLGRISADEDHRREVLLRAWAQLQDRDFAKLRAFADHTSERGADGARLKAFLRRVVKNLGIDYLRTLPEYIRHRGPAAPPDAGASSARYWRSIVTITSGLHAELPDVEGAALARRMLEFLDESMAPARRRAAELADAGLAPAELAAALGLTDPADAVRAARAARERRLYRPALELWSTGLDAGEIASSLGLGSAADAERVIGAAKELLRRHFRAEEA
jgi:DNA-directed RNA polymerase specialized sigma24 family protein